MRHISTCQHISVVSHKTIIVSNNIIMKHLLQHIIQPISTHHNLKQTPSSRVEVGTLGSSFPFVGQRWLGFPWNPVCAGELLRSNGLRMFNLNSRFWLLANHLSTHLLVLNAWHLLCGTLKMNHSTSVLEKLCTFWGRWEFGNSEVTGKSHVPTLLMASCGARVLHEPSIRTSAPKNHWDVFTQTECKYQQQQQQHQQQQAVNSAARLWPNTRILMQKDLRHLAAGVKHLTEALEKEKVIPKRHTKGKGKNLRSRRSMIADELLLLGHFWRSWVLCEGWFLEDQYRRYEKHSNTQRWGKQTAENSKPVDLFGYRKHIIVGHYCWFPLLVLQHLVWDHIWFGVTQTHGVTFFLA